MTPVDIITWFFMGIVFIVLGVYIYVTMIRPILSGSTRPASYEATVSSKPVSSKEDGKLFLCVREASSFLVKNYERLGKKGAPAILIKYGKDGFMEVSVAVYSHGDILDEYVICSS